MSPAELSDLKAREEAKRARVQESATDWKKIEAELSWAESQLPAALRRNRPRVHPGKP